MHLFELVAYKPALVACTVAAAAAVAAASCEGKVVKSPVGSAILMLDVQLWRCAIRYTSQHHHCQYEQDKVTKR